MKKKILIIDDEKDFCDIMKFRLKQLGKYKVLIARGHNMGMWISRCKWHKPDLILLDLMIPDIDGYEILRRLKKGKETSHTPVIILTARTDLASKKKAEDLGCDDYIVKPIEARALQSRIERVLAKYPRKDRKESMLER